MTNTNTYIFLLIAKATFLLCLKCQSQRELIFHNAWAAFFQKLMVDTDFYHEAPLKTKAA